MQVELLPATDQDLPVVRNLTDFYVYDMSESCGWDFPESGRIGGVDDLPEYWRQPGRYVFVVRVDGRLAGFACVKRLRDQPTPLHDIGEFFIVRKYRGQGVGRQVAYVLFDRFPGDWQVRQLPENAPATRFWRRIIQQYTGGNVTEIVASPAHGSKTVQLFRSRKAAPGNE